jgi:hypothetical protein
MYDVYLDGKAGLLVVPRGSLLPAALCGSWRKKKRAVRYVSEAIRKDVQRQGYHRRKRGSRNAKEYCGLNADGLAAGLHVFNSAVKVSEQRAAHASLASPFAAT